MRLAIAWIGLVFSCDAWANTVIEREIPRSDWAIQVSRNLWDDSILAYAVSSQAKVLDGSGAVTLAIICRAKIPALALQWPTTLRTEADGNVGFLMRIGNAAPERTQWESHSSTQAQTKPNGLLVLDDLQHVSDRMRHADQIVVGPGYFPSSAAVVSLNGYKDAWHDMARFCESGALP
jgi:hypothetical protein